MDDEIITLAMFYDPTEAQLVKNRLEAAGVPATLGGDATSALFPGLGGSIGTIHLHVPKKYRKRARKVLRELDRERGEDEPEAGDNSGMEAVDDSPVEHGEAVQKKPAASRRDDLAEDDEDSSGHASPEPRQESAISPTLRRWRKKPTHDDVDDEPVLRWGPDQVARRAWLAGVLSLILLGMACGFWGGIILLYLAVQFYAVWLLVRLMLQPEELSRRGSFTLYAALAVNGVTIVSFIWAITQLPMLAMLRR
jgi:hypothetical protein